MSTTRKKSTERNTCQAEEEKPRGGVTDSYSQLLTRAFKGITEEKLRLGSKESTPFVSRFVQAEVWSRLLCCLLCILTTIASLGASRSTFHQVSAERL